MDVHLILQPQVSSYNTGTFSNSRWHWKKKKSRTCFWLYSPVFIVYHYWYSARGNGISPHPKSIHFLLLVQREWADNTILALLIVDIRRGNKDSVGCFTLERMRWNGNYWVHSIIIITSLSSKHEYMPQKVAISFYYTPRPYRVSNPEHSNCFQLLAIIYNMTHLHRPKKTRGILILI